MVEITRLLSISIQKEITIEVIGNAEPIIVKKLLRDLF
jgi:hypothetical protein